ncbi:unnamed protein product, partial [Ectocarpus fasciculatus]
MSVCCVSECLQLKDVGNLKCQQTATTQHHQLPRVGDDPRSTRDMRGDSSRIPRPVPPSQKEAKKVSSSVESSHTHAANDGKQKVMLSCLVLLGRTTSVRYQDQGRSIPNSPQPSPCLLVP